MGLTHIPAHGSLEEEDETDGKGQVSVAIITEGGVRYQHEDIGNHVREAAPHADLVEHLTHHHR